MITEVNNIVLKEELLYAAKNHPAFSGYLLSCNRMLSLKNPVEWRNFA